MQNLYENKFDCLQINAQVERIFKRHCFAPRVVLIQSNMYKATQTRHTVFTNAIQFFEPVIVLLFLFSIT